MGYLYLMMGVIIGSAVLPATLTLTWSGQNQWAVSTSPQSINLDRFKKKKTKKKKPPPKKPRV